MLHGTRFIGRVDPRLDREKMTMVINGIFMEPGIDPPVIEIADALTKFCKYHSARRIEILMTRPDGLKERLEKAFSTSCSLITPDRENHDWEEPWKTPRVEQDSDYSWR
jgi:hypothetical protein